MNNNLKEEIEEELAWSWAKFFIGLAKLVTSQEFIVFAVYSVVIIMSMTNKWALASNKSWIIGYIIISCIFILKKCLERVLEIVANNTNINAEVKLGAQKTIITDTAKVIKANGVNADL